MNIEAIPELDICVLLKRDWLRTEEFRARSLGWPRKAITGLDIVLIADRRDPNEPLLHAQSWSEDWRDRTWQKIDLVYGSRGAQSVLSFAAGTSEFERLMSALRPNLGH